MALYTKAVQARIYPVSPAHALVWCSASIKRIEATHAHQTVYGDVNSCMELEGTPSLRFVMRTQVRATISRRLTSL